MGPSRDGERYRVLLPQALGSDEFLRVTWHQTHQMVVFSHWQGPSCTAATPVRINDLGELASLIVDAFARGVSNAARTWPAPEPDQLVVPATGLTVPDCRRTA
jgi:hypothetical protein